MTAPDRPPGPEGDPIAETIARVRELDTHPHTWKAPWVARTFEIDCPCPNGEDCGDPHDCCEVEAPEEYPDGQCVVQIHVPGLETFARPTAELIAFYRTAAPQLAAECQRLRRALEDIAGYEVPTFGEVALQVCRDMRDDAFDALKGTR
ncbi:MAG: hypothetical protein AMXMBFR56_66300 [Polyangiaceae bacterium]